jgi:Flp pilus assembly protein CpaB
VKKKSPPYALIGAVLLGLVAIYAFMQYRDAEEKKAQDAAAQARAEMQHQLDLANASKVTVAPVATNVRLVLYATQPVEPGVRISSAFYEKKLTPVEILPDAYTDQSDIVGWFATRKIEKGDPLTPRNIGKSLPYMSQRISAGMRLLVLPVLNAGDTGGFVVDGDRVDLFFTSRSETQMVMQNLNVLYVAGSPVKTEKTDGVNSIAPVPVAFEVTPEQAQALLYLSQNTQGHFSMLLKARKDQTEIAVKPFNGADYDMDNLKRVQTKVDASIERVNLLRKEIEEKEKNLGSGNTNETTNPTPPSP